MMEETIIANCMLTSVLMFFIVSAVSSSLEAWYYPEDTPEWIMWVSVIFYNLFALICVVSALYLIWA